MYLPGPIPIGRVGCALDDVSIVGIGLAVVVAVAIFGAEEATIFEDHGCVADLLQNDW